MASKTKNRKSSKTWQCMECGKEFNSNAKYEPRCPRCHGVDIDINAGYEFISEEFGC